MNEPRTPDGFMALVGRMRDAQEAFYRKRRKADADEHHRLLTEALRLEREVDEALDEMAARLPLFDPADEEMP